VNEKEAWEQVVIVDDIISTGGTVAQASKLAYSLGAKSVIAAAVHLLLSNNAKERLVQAGVKNIIGTNTVKTEDKDIIVVDISYSIASVL
ncbi:ribose-phosphate pyrophosphokinase, partial [Sulfolobus sp. B5]